METALISAVVAICVAGLTYLGVRRQSSATETVEERRTSGNVNTTQADTLWAEAEKIRRELREELERERSQTAEERAAMRSDIDEARGEHVECQRRLAQVERELAQLKGKLRDV